MFIRKRWHISVLILTLALLIGGLLSYTFVKNGYFPVAKVEGKYISYKTVSDSANVSRKIYEKGLAGEDPEMEILFKRSSSPELFKRVLEGLITNEIMKAYASTDSISKAEKDIETNFGAGSMASVADTIKELYGWDTDQFKQRILEPKALFDAMTSEKGSDFDKWLMDSKNKADVRIWFVPFEWKEGRLENRK